MPNRQQRVRVRNRRHARAKQKRNLAKRAKELGVSLADLLAQRREAHGVRMRFHEQRVNDVIRERENNRGARRFDASMRMGASHRAADPHRAGRQLERHLGVGVLDRYGP